MSPTRSELCDWEWLQRHRGGSWPRLLATLLAERARSNPNEEIVSVGSRLVTVQEYVNLVASLGSHLAEEAFSGPVVVLTDRNLESAVSISAVQWAGRCLIPLSGQDPPDRISEVVNRIGPCTIIDATDTPTIRRMDGSSVAFADVKEQWIEPVTVNIEDPAVVLFSSGSTGQPKGAVRRGWQQDASFARFLEVHQEDRAAIFGPLQWLGGLQTFYSGIVKGYVRLMDSQSTKPEKLFEELNVHHIKHALAAGSLIRMLAQVATNGRKLESVVRVRSQGETLNADVIRDIRSLCAQPVAVEANYGATELLDLLARYTLEPDEEIPRGQIPLGEPSHDLVRLVPIENADGHMAEVVARRWVADGYWKDQELNVLRFGRDEQGDPIWRSGDLVRVDPSGTWFFAGRMDDMIKISGRLVEPSEATRGLLRIRGVRNAVVLPRQIDRGPQQLVAHVDVEQGISSDAVRAELARQLPAYLIPAVIMRHDSLPVMERGKLDRQRLAAVELHPWRDKALVQPRSAMEELVVVEAQRFLSIDEISVDDNLWHLGLDSLGAIEFSEVLASRTGDVVSPNDFLGATTPAELAIVLESKGVDRHSAAFEFHPHGSRFPIFCVTGAGGMALSFRHLAAEFGPERPVASFEQFGRFRGGVRDRTVEAAAERNLRQLRSFRFDDPILLVGHSWGGLVAHHMAGRLRRDGHDVRLVLLDTYVPVAGRKNRRPPALRQRTRGWPAHFYWLTYWRLAVAKVRMSDWLRLSDRSERFYRYGQRSARRYRPQQFDGPLLIVEAEGSTCASSWKVTSNHHVVRVSGGHNSLLEPPHVAGVAEVIRLFLQDGMATDQWGSVAVSE